jgi:two-component system, sensor histidine kinase
VSYRLRLSVLLCVMAGVALSVAALAIWVMYNANLEHTRGTNLSNTDIRESFFVAIQITIFGATALILLGVLLFRFVSTPISQQLQETINRLAIAQRIAQMGNWERNLSTGEIWWSDEMYRIFGAENGEFTGSLDSFLAFVHPEDLFKLKQVITNAVETKKPYFLEYRLIRTDGEERRVQTRGAVEVNKDGFPINLSGTVQDITELKSVEGALQASEERFRDFTAASSDWYWEMDSDFKFIYFSEKFYETTGLTPDERIGTFRDKYSNPRDLFDESRTWARHHADLQEHKPFKDFEYESHLPNGRTLITQTSGIPIFDADGVFIGYRGTARNISNQKRTLYLLQDAVESIPNGFALYDSDDRLALYNGKYISDRPGVEKVICIGETFEEHIRKLSKLGIRNKNSEISIPIEERIKRHQNPTEPWTSPQPDGRVMQIDEFKTASGGTAVIRTDVTKLARTEQALRTSRDQLEQRVEARTIYLRKEIRERKRMEKQLRDAVAAEESAHQAKSRFLASASHDVRQPLHALGLFLSVLDDNRKNKTEIDDEKAGELISRMQGSLEALEHLFEALSDISKLDSGLTRPDPMKFSVSSLLNHLAVEFKPQARAKGLDFRFVDADQSVLTDEKLLEQILRNLLANAIRFTDQGRILFGARRSHGNLLLEVHDTGIGIDADQLTSIFEEFYQIDNAERDRKKGLGLGLAYVEKAAKILDLKLTINSTKEKGSRFVIEVPLVKFTAQHQAKSVNSIEPPALDGKNKTIIVIDDDRDVLSGLKLRLDAWNYNALIARSADEAKRIIQDEKVIPDLILSDLRLENGLDGVHAIHAVRAATRQNVPGYILTGDTAPEFLKITENTGFTVLHKPVRAEKLAQILQDAFNEADSHVS